MSDLFDDAQDCIDWADKKVEAFEAAVSTYTRDCWERNTRRDELRGVDVKAIHIIKQPPKSLRMLTKEIAHDLRSALDLTICATAERLKPPGIKPEKCSFPIARGGLKEFDDLLKRRAIARISPRLEALIREFHPYKGGDLGLFMLHLVNRYEKHVRLSTLATQARVTEHRVRYTHPDAAVSFPLQGRNWQDAKSGLELYSISAGAPHDIETDFGLDIGLEKPQGLTIPVQDWLMIVSCQAKVLIKRIEKEVL
ncbi:MAG: hypothetical protein AAFY10_04995 [Pseudomonadota bacterium]